LSDGRPARCGAEDQERASACPRVPPDDAEFEGADDAPTAGVRPATSPDPEGALRNRCAADLCERRSAVAVGGGADVGGAAAKAVNSGGENYGGSVLVEPCMHRAHT
jgi:hypothetical protein